MLTNDIRDRYMLSSISVVGTGTIITILVVVFRLLGFDIAEGEIAKGVEGFVALMGLVLLIVGQLRRKDLSFGLFRKQ